MPIPAAATDVQVIHHNDGFSVSYLSRQSALRATFVGEQQARDAVKAWNEKGDFQLNLLDDVVDVRYNVDEARAKMGLKPLAEDQDGEYFVEHLIVLGDFDLDADDAKSVITTAQKGLDFISSDDRYRPVLQRVIEFGSQQKSLRGSHAKAMIEICKEGVAELASAGPKM